jgi:glycosyltransferase involved in cell wall biosynthesis
VKEPKVSLIVPGYKCDEFVSRNIESIFDQDYGNYEIIFVPNGQWETKDGLVKSISEKYGDKVKILNLEQGNLGNANNEGLQYQRVILSAICLLTCTSCREHCGTGWRRLTRIRPVAWSIQGITL